VLSQRASSHATLVTLDNGVIKVGVDTTYGSAITYLSQSGSTTNLVNDNDYGRQVQQSYYSGPDNFHPPGTRASKSFSRILHHCLFLTAFRRGFRGKSISV